MSKLRWLIILMGAVILLITGFQAYWLKDNYHREKKAVEVRTNLLFRETVRQMQDSLLRQKLQVVISDSSASRDFVREEGKTNGTIVLPRQPRRAAQVLRLLNNRITEDSAEKSGSTMPRVFVSMKGRGNFADKDSAGKFKIDIDSINPHSIREMVLVKARNHPLSDSIKGEMKITATQDRGIHLSPRRPAADTQESAYSNTIRFTDGGGNNIMIRIDSLFNDTIPVSEISKQFSKTLKDEKLDLPFSVSHSKEDRNNEESMLPGMGFSRTSGGYELELGKVFPFLLKKIQLPILFSVFLIGITIFSFVLLYRSLLRQHRLAQLKNDLISNITHELKTPIATVGVAIEALKNFNAIQDPGRTKEYLDISQNELQRLGLLVDKVLKLSMFENKKIEIKKELFNLQGVVDEVVASLRLQAEKYNARITISHEGSSLIKGDRLHLLSVVFNLLDNALKYSKGNAAIQVVLKEEPEEVILQVTDNGIGIPPAYRDKVFEKFFRVPAGDTHNAKGHGLGLSYVAQVVRQHQGTIQLDSHEGLGSTFTLRLPKSPEANN